MRECICSGIAAAKSRGQHFGRPPGQSAKALRLTPKVLYLVEQGHSYRQIAKELHLSKNTVNEIAKQYRKATLPSLDSSTS